MRFTTFGLITLAIVISTAQAENAIRSKDGAMVSFIARSEGMIRKRAHPHPHPQMSPNQGQGDNGNSNGNSNTNNHPHAHPHPHPQVPVQSNPQSPMDCTYDQQGTLNQTSTNGCPAKTQPGTQGCQVGQDQGQHLIGAKALQCSSVCVLGSCPSNSQMCQVQPSNSNSLIGIMALDCTPAGILSMFGGGSGSGGSSGGQSPPSTGNMGQTQQQVTPQQSSGGLLSAL